MLGKKLFICRLVYVQIFCLMVCWFLYQNAFANDNVTCMDHVINALPLRMNWSIRDKSFGKIKLQVLLSPPTQHENGLLYGNLISSYQMEDGSYYERSFLLTDRYFPYFQNDLQSHKIKGRVLDIGCGAKGKSVNKLRADGVDAYGLDLVILDPNSVFLRQGSFTDMPFEDNYFSYIYSDFSIFMYLDFFNEFEAKILRSGLYEIIRTLRPGGIFVPHANNHLAAWIANEFPQFEAFLLGSGADYFVKK